MRVLFISKPIVAPFHDGTKCLVRDVASSLTRVDALVLVTRGAAPFPSTQRPVELVPVYATSGKYAPSLAQNVRAFAWVVLQSRADAWHFVFAPNPRTSKVGSLMRRLRRVPVVQTIASPPRDFTNIDELLFGDRVVAQSTWTRQQVVDAYARKGKPAPEIAVIPPPVSADLEYSAERALRVRAEYGIPRHAPLFVYPGDLEVSSGARVTREIAGRLAKRVPGAVTVFAYRKKTDQADVIARKLAAELDPASTRILGSVPDVLELIASATAVIFPVDDLFGKVDLPIVLLEAMVLGVPVVALDRGPLADLDFATLIPSLDPDAWIEQLAALAHYPERWRAASDRQKLRVRERHAASAVARAYEELYLGLASSGYRGADARAFGSLDGASTS